MKDSYNRDPLVAAAEAMMLTEDVAKIKNKVAQLEVGDKTNYGTVVAIGSDSITFKAKDTPKTKIAFRQRKMGRPDYLLMNLVKLTPDGKKVDKTFKESNEFVGAAAAAKVAGEDEFEFEGEKFPTTIGLAIAKKIVGEGKDLDESNEFVGAAAAAKVAGEDEFEFEGEKFPTTIGLAVAKKIIGESSRGVAEGISAELEEGNNRLKAHTPQAAQRLIKKLKNKYQGYKWDDMIKGDEIIYPNEPYIKRYIKKQPEVADMKESAELEEAVGTLQNSLKVLAKDGISGRVTDIQKLAKVIHKNYKAITGKDYEDSESVATSEIIADLIIHLKVNPDKFISAWDKTIKEGVELEERRKMKLITKRQWDKADEDQRFEWLGMAFDDPDDAEKYIAARWQDLPPVAHSNMMESTELEEALDAADGAMKGIKAKERLNYIDNIVSTYEGKDLNWYKKVLFKNPRFKDKKLTPYELKALKRAMKESAVLEEAAGDEWFTCEIHVKSSGQLYSTFYVQAKDMGEANKKADKVFKELMKTTYPKDWPSYQKKFTVKVKKGDNIGELMP